jgi:hypothetical protein
MLPAKIALAIHGYARLHICQKVQALDPEYFSTKFFKKIFEHAFECQDDDFSQN